MLNKIRVVMIETSHPGNIGAAARAMKNMSLSRLYLVRPKSFPDEEAYARASGATDVLDQAVICETLEEALEGAQVVYGSSARDRTLQWPVVNPRECAEQVFAAPPEQEAALVFGRERTGLTNDELEKCTAMLQIPTNPDYSSLNVASAIQVVSYEMHMQSHMAQQKGAVTKAEEEPLASQDQLQGYYEHLEKTLVDIEFLDPKNPRQLMRRLQRFYNRCQPTVIELNILRGILKHTLRAKEGVKRW